jgi:hypothetical protein
MGFNSDALNFLIEKLDPVETCKFAALLIIDVCEKLINTFERVKAHIEHEYADQLVECRETGSCKSHREAKEEEQRAREEKRIFMVGPDGQATEVSGADGLFERLKDLMQAGEGTSIAANPDGTIDRDSLPEEMPEELKDKLVEELPKIAASITSTIEGLRECKTEEERQALLALLRADMQVKH